MVNAATEICDIGIVSVTFPHSSILLQSGRWFTPGMQVTGWKRKALLGTALKDNTARNTKQPLEQTYLYLNKWNIIIQVPRRSHPHSAFGSLMFWSSRQTKCKVEDIFLFSSWVLISSQNFDFKKPRTARKTSVHRFTCRATTSPDNKWLHN